MIYLAISLASCTFPNRFIYVFNHSYINPCRNLLLWNNVSMVPTFVYSCFIYRQLFIHAILLPTRWVFYRRITVPTRNALYHKTMSEKQPKPVIKKFNCSFYYTSLNQDNSGYTSTYQYIEDRFGRSFKLLLCVIYTFNTIVYAGIGMFN